MVERQVPSESGSRGRLGLSPSEMRVPSLVGSVLGAVIHRDFGSRKSTGTEAPPHADVVKRNRKVRGLPTIFNGRQLSADSWSGDELLHAETGEIGGACPYGP